MRGWPFGLACPLLCWAAVPLVIHAQAQTARISGTVVDPAEHFLPGVEVTLTSVEGDPPTDDAPAGSVVASTITSETGQFEFDGLSAGSYIIIAELSGYGRGVHPPVQTLEGRSIDVRLPLVPARLSEVVTVVASTGAGEPIEADEFQVEFLRLFQLPTDRFQEALPLLPGVIRDP